MPPATLIQQPGSPLSGADASASAHAPGGTPPVTDSPSAAGSSSAAGSRPPTDRYGYCFDDSTVQGVRVIGHNGGSPGYESNVDILATLGYVVVVLANLDRAALPVVRRARELSCGGR